MKTKAQKKQNLGELKKRLDKSSLTIFTTYARHGQAGLSVKEISELRKSLKKADCDYVAEKRTLLDLTLKESEKQVPSSTYDGSLGIAYSYGDQIAPAKTIYEFSKNHPALKYFGALFNGKYIDVDSVTELAKLPSREVLIGKVLGMLNYPITGFVNVLSGTMRNLVVVLDQIKANKS